MKSDSVLRADVEQELDWDPAIEARSVGVNVQDGVVTLTGTVPDLFTRYGVRRAVERVAGVVGIADELEIEPTDYISDTDIAGAVAHALDWDPSVPKGRITSVVNQGQVILTGEVSWNYQKEAAERAVRHLRGVRSVLNEITIRPIVEPESLKEKIELAFARQAIVDAKNVTVTVSGGHVILRGNVGSWHERQQAAAVAGAAPGVTFVENHLGVKL